ncbi:MAG: ECF transporter S component [Clostridiales bacterium]|nr:ECF transporter S component [Clostridiales bacterium]
MQNPTTVSKKSKAKGKSKVNVKMLAFSAMFAALITVTTAFIKIPSALGYTHAGDSMIYLAASILPGPYAIVASSIGGALADIISGYAYWALPTAIIKAFNAVPFVLCRMILKKYNRDDRIINIPNLLMLIPTTAVTVFGYLLANALLYDWAAAVAELATWYLQPGVGAIIYIALGTGLDSIKFKQKMLPRILR